MISFSNFTVSKYSLTASIASFTPSTVVFSLTSIVKNARNSSSVKVFKYSSISSLFLDLEAF
jgi:hypothetical protein